MSVSENLRIVCFSFGYKYGSPLNANFLLDVRCLPNPYWDERLRDSTGLVAEVAAYVLESEAGKELKGHLETFFPFWFAQHLCAGKEVLRIAIGCTGGRHRSVALVEALSDTFRRGGYHVEHFHRDIGKDG